VGDVIYKRISHVRVTESYDTLEDMATAQDIKWHPAQRYYADGQVISYKLPQTYDLAVNPNQSCNTCVYRNPSNSVCSRWDALVRPEYTCPHWTQT
jgi:protein involved in temperature-dependent protein secretion